MTNYISNNLEAVKEYLNDLSAEELIRLHNNYCYENSSEDEIFTNDDDFFNTFFDGKVIDAVRAVSYGEYKYSDDYVRFNGYGNLESFNRHGAIEHIDITAIAEDILENPRNYDDIELEETESEEA